MKKLIGLLASIGLISSTGSAVIACGGTKNKSEEKPTTPTENLGTVKTDINEITSKSQKVKITVNLKDTLAPNQELSLFSDLGDKSILELPKKLSKTFLDKKVYTGTIKVKDLGIVTEKLSVKIGDKLVGSEVSIKINIIGDVNLSSTKIASSSDEVTLKVELSSALAGNESLEVISDKGDKSLLKLSKFVKNEKDPKFYTSIIKLSKNVDGTTTEMLTVKKGDKLVGKATPIEIMPVGEVTLNSKIITSIKQKVDITVKINKTLNETDKIVVSSDKGTESVLQISEFTKVGSYFKGTISLKNLKDVPFTTEKLTFKLGNDNIGPGFTIDIKHFGETYASKVIFNKKDDTSKIEVMLNKPLGEGEKLYISKSKESNFNVTNLVMDPKDNKKYTLDVSIKPEAIGYGPFDTPATEFISIVINKDNKSGVVGLPLPFVFDYHNVEISMLSDFLKDVKLSQSVDLKSQKQIKDDFISYVNKLVESYSSFAPVLKKLDINKLVNETVKIEYFNDKKELAKDNIDTVRSFTFEIIKGKEDSLKGLHLTGKAEAYVSK